MKRSWLLAFFSKWHLVGATIHVENLQIARADQTLKMAALRKGLAFAAVFEYRQPRHASSEQAF